MDCNRQTSTKYARRCKDCFVLSKRVNHTRREYARNWTLRKKYGIGTDAIMHLLMIQSGKCAICRQIMKQPASTRGQALDTITVDHDHKTGNLRSLLCSGCNKGIGLLKDDIEIIVSALRYLGGGHLLNES